MQQQAPAHCLRGGPNTIETTSRQEIGHITVVRDTMKDDGQGSDSANSVGVVVEQLDA